MKPSTKFALVLLAVLLACSLTLTAQEEQKPAPKPEPRLTNWYKVDIALNEFEDGRKTNTRNYTVNAEDSGGPAVIKLGDRVPILTGPKASINEQQNELVNREFRYMDVGLEIECHVRDRQGRLGLSLSVEQSSVTFPDQSVRTAPNQPIVRQLRMSNTAFVNLGKQALVASVDDPGKTNHKYTVEATVTKLNP